MYGYSTITTTSTTSTNQYYILLLDIYTLIQLHTYTTTTITTTTTIPHHTTTSTPYLAALSSVCLHPSPLPYHRYPALLQKCVPDIGAAAPKSNTTHVNSCDT